MNTTTKTQLTHNNLDVEIRSQMIALLNQQLADSFDLYSQVKQAHWNVKGMQFIALHELFDEIAGLVLGFTDDIAERVRALGADAQGTLRQAAENSKLPEFPDGLIDSQEYTQAVAQRVGAFAGSSRRAIDIADDAGDMVKADLFTEITRELDKQLYFLDAHLQ